MNDYEGVRVVHLIDDVQAEAGVETGYGSDSFEGEEEFQGPGFIGRTDHGEELVFSMDQVVPGSKAKYYFPVNDELSTVYRRLAGLKA